VVDAEESRKKPKVTIHCSVKVQLQSSLWKNRQDPQVTSKRLEEVVKRLLVKQAKVTSEPENLFDMDGDVQEASPGVVTEETLQKPTENNSAELLRYHYKFGHVSFAGLQAMAKQGTLPAKLAKCPLPVSVCIMFLWQGYQEGYWDEDPHLDFPAEKGTQPGEAVSVDCLTSGDPGLIAQMRGGLTNARYMHTCVFINHYSDLSYIHLLKSQSGEEVLKAKEVFEAYANTFGIEI
jgi:hypothetical protein